MAHLPRPRDKNLGPAPLSVLPSVRVGKGRSPRAEERRRVGLPRAVGVLREANRVGRSSGERSISEMERRMERSPDEEERPAFLASSAMTTTTIRSLSEETLLGFRERAAHHDAVGRFAVADLDELRAAGWFSAALPEELGGLGLSLAELAVEQRRMARYSPATALSTSMHHYWVGLAADLHRMGCPGRTSSLGTWTTASWSPPGTPTRPVPSWCTASCRTGLRASQRCATGTPRGC